MGALSKSASHQGAFAHAGTVYAWNDVQKSGSQLWLRGACWVSNAANTSCLDAWLPLPLSMSSVVVAFGLPVAK